MKRVHDYNSLKLQSGWEISNSFLKHLEGKKVILVGPAAYMQGSGLGKEINKYDVIVRMNLSCPIPQDLKKDIGSRTDILYHLVLRNRHENFVSTEFNAHTKEQIKAWMEDGVKWVVVKENLERLESRGANVKNFVEAMTGENIKWTNISSYEMRKLSTHTRISPNMGTIAIYHLLQSKLAELKVVGCDFHSTGYYIGYGGFNEEQAAKGEGGFACWGQKDEKRVRRTHRLEGQLDFITRTMLKDTRLKVDDNLMSILRRSKTWTLYSS